MDSVKSLVFGVLGFITGIVFFVLFVTGIAVGASGRILIRATEPVAQGELQISNNPSLGTLNQEVGTILSTIGVGQETTISEDGLTRLIGAFFKDLAVNSPEFQPQNIEIDLEPDRIQGIFGFTIVPESMEEPFSSVKAVPLVLRFDLEVFQEGETLYLRLQELMVGDLTLPLGLAPWLEGLVGQYIEEGSENALRFSSSGIQGAIPLTDISTELSEFASLKEVKVLQDKLSVSLEPNTEFSNELVGQFSRVARENGYQGLRILDRYIDDQTLMANARSAVQALSTLPISPSAPQVQAVFWQSLNTLRGIAAEIGSLPENDAQALIQELHVLLGNSNLSTELLGRTLR